MTRIAIVLFNLGGPDRPQAVRPFLFNLFNDPAIMRLPALLRWLVAKLISFRRAPVARAIYGRIGGGSPILANTRAQADAVEAAAQALIPGSAVRSFIAMRYWRPRAAETAREVARFAPDRTILLPLYPQFSTTTTASSCREWRDAAATAGITGTATAICCYPSHRGLIAAVADLVRREIAAAARPRVLFSAHGLPKNIVARGDPYQWQVEQTAAAVAAALGPLLRDWIVCYQSRVGPLAWIGPSTPDEIRRAGRDRVAIVIVPIAFVSEHSETLVELDIEYRRLAVECGVPEFRRVPTVAVHQAFIAGLAEMVRDALARPPGVASSDGARLCPAQWSGCAQPLPSVPLRP